jgi:geranylgeranyl diphosphate synthase, type II
LSLRYKELSQQFSEYFSKKHFPDKPETLYGAASYMLEDGGKRIRPVLCLMGNEVFGPIKPETWIVASTLELFHNFTLIHDDIMDKAPLRRGKETVHAKYNDSTALLAGDVMLLQAYEYLNESGSDKIKDLIRLLNKTGREVCEGQQLDMDFEKADSISLSQYLLMIELKTAVFLAASLRMGAMIASATEADQLNIFEFGKNIGLAFQVQDDWLDSFGNPSTFGKQNGGDILANKKTFLLVSAQEKASVSQKKIIRDLLLSSSADKIQRMLEIYRIIGVDREAESAKKNYMERAYRHLDKIAVPPENKIALKDLAVYLLEREI